jgi:hypothetical protein
VIGEKATLFLMGIHVQAIAPFTVDDEWIVPREDSSNILQESHIHEWEKTM